MSSTENTDKPVEEVKPETTAEGTAQDVSSPPYNFSFPRGIRQGTWRVYQIPFPLSTYSRATQPVPHYSLYNLYTATPYLPRERLYSHDEI
jgi:hypothetical protein